MNGEARNPRILVVDDDSVTRLLVSEALSGAGFEVREAEDGAEALAAVDAIAPDLVLLDVHMPNLDGYETCARLRRQRGGTALPILMMTASDDLAAVERAFAVGATDFTTKPLNLSLMAHRLRYLLRAARAFQEANEAATRLGHTQRLARLAHFRMVGREIDWAPGAWRCLGLGDTPPSPAIADLLALVHPDDRERVDAALGSEKAHQIDYRLILPDGRERLLHQEAEIVVDERGGEALIGATQDVTELRLAERQITRLAYFDPLTSLPNRTFIGRYLARALAQARRYQQAMAVLAIDLDLFKRVNDTYGHAAGDALLREAGDRIASCIRGGDTVARPTDLPIAPEGWSGETVTARAGGDEFVVVLSRVRRADDAAAVAQRIVQTLARPFQVGSAEVFVSSSIGIATYPEAGDDAETLLGRADAAVYHAKERGRNGYQFFNQSIQERAQRRADLETRLRAAIARLDRQGGPGGGSAAEPQEFSLVYQPKVAAATGQVTGVEALLRWTPSDRPPIPPSEFIPVAEDTGLIVRLGEWVARRACEQGAAWQRAGMPLSVAVNISARQFREPDFVATIARLIDSTGFRNLELEITEHLMMQDTELSPRVLAQLKGLGARIAVDDFGTGYSSLGYLSRFPIDTLKIDRSFVADLGASKTSEAITAAIIAMSRSLRMQVVAEGVETAVQRDFLRRLDCDELQGYFFAKPVAPHEIAGLRARLGAAGTPAVSLVEPGLAIRSAPF
jgi:predicted signal transduction protein with EAL and GGDEF domain/FixJ family two-component response regulator